MQRVGATAYDVVAGMKSVGKPGVRLLTDDQVLEARLLYEPRCGRRPGTRSSIWLAQRYGVSVSTMRAILKGQRYHHLLPDSSPVSVPIRTAVAS